MFGSYLCFVFALLIFVTNATHDAEISNTKGMPTKTMGVYVLLADDTHSNFTTDTDWQPQLYSYQEKGFNVFWFTFINPQTMPKLPKSFINFANCRGERGCPSDSQLIIFSIGGQVYGETAWPWLDNETSAINMANEVVSWFTEYNIDGIDIDIEGNAGNDNNAANNAIIFVDELKNQLNNLGYTNKQLNNIQIRGKTDNIKNNDTSSSRGNNIITLPVYGYPQITAENTLVNTCFDSTKNACYDDINSIGIMVYDNLESLQWVNDYADATNEYQGFPITCNVPINDIIVGIQGTANDSIISELAEDVLNENLGGIMVWYASVYDATRKRPGLQYQNGLSDASTMMNQTGTSWYNALNTMSQ